MYRKKETIISLSIKPPEWLHILLLLDHSDSQQQPHHAFPPHPEWITQTKK